MVNRTKEYILDVFNEMLKTTPMQKITVEGICSRAQIAKSTFYKYYLDKYDIMNYNYKLIIDSNIKSRDNYTWTELFKAILDFMQSHASAMRKSFETQGVNSFNSFMYDYSVDLVQTTSHIVRGTELSPQEAFQTSVFCHGSVDMCKDWLDGKFALSSAEAAELLIPMLPPSLAKLHPRLLPDCPEH